MDVDNLLAAGIAGLGLGVGLVVGAAAWRWIRKRLEDDNGQN